MATARSLTGLDWLVRTYTPQLLIACNQPGKASTLAAAQPVTNTARLNAAIVALNSYEAGIRAEVGPTFDAFWSTALDYVTAHVAAAVPIPIDEMITDPDETVKQAVKTCLRADELEATKFLVNGGTLPL